MEDTEWGRAVIPSPAKGLKAEEEDSHESCCDEDNVDVAIVGGGLAGLVVAIGLLRANINCVVFERAPQLRSTSQGILAVQPNGMKALAQIHPDLPAMVVAAGCERNQIVSTTIKADGSVKESVREIGKECMEKFGSKKVGLTWHNMQQLLASLVPPEKIQTSRSLISFSESENDIVLRFDDCHSSPSPIRRSIRANVALACDGVFSVARGQMFQNLDDCPLYFGQINWGTVIESSKLPSNIHPPNAIHYFSCEGDPRWMSMLNDGGAGQTFWQFRVSDPAQALSLSVNKGRGGLGLKGVKKALLPVVQASQVVAGALECIPEDQIFERSIVGRLPATTWLSKRGRLALVGDSAHGMHPNISQGANSAFESAAVVVQTLAQEVGMDKKDSALVEWSKALQAYETQRKPKADFVQRFANMMGCYQASGETAIPKNVIPTVIDWITGEDPKNRPSQAILDTIFAFDPIAQTTVSKIQ